MNVVVGLAAQARPLRPGHEAAANKLPTGMVSASVLTTKRYSTFLDRY